MDPSSLLGVAGREIVTATIKEMRKRSKNIDKTLSEEFKIRGKEMRVECPQSIQHYSVVFETKGSRILPKKRNLTLEKSGECLFDL